MSPAQGRALTPAGRREPSRETHLTGYDDMIEGGMMTVEYDPTPVPVNLFAAPNALAVIDAATAMATPLAGIIEEQKLYTDIKGRRHVRVEGWTLLGSMLGVFPVVCWSRPLDGGWEARVEARTRDGAIVGAAEAECLRAESKWKDRDDYAIRSMAQTRATSKALRLPLGFVIQLAGFETTPAEEMDGIEVEAQGPPCPHCRAPVVFNDEKTRVRPGKRDLPVWSCPNRGCGGGGLRDKNDPSKGNYSWGSYDADFFANLETGGPLEVTAPGLESKPAVPPDAFDDLTVNLKVLGVTDEQAHAELEAYRDNGGFAAGHVKEIRERVNRACVLLVALGLEPEGVQGELFREWQNTDIENRRALSWSTVRGADVPSFARHVQAFLRVRGQ